MIDQNNWLRQGWIDARSKLVIKIVTSDDDCIALAQAIMMYDCDDRSIDTSCWHTIKCEQESMNLTDLIINLIGFNNRECYVVMNEYHKYFVQIHNFQDTEKVEHSTICLQETVQKYWQPLNHLCWCMPHQTFASRKVWKPMMNKMMFDKTTTCSLKMMFALE
jgi:hypothetical protein